jgi:hypothetical protein
MNVHSSPPFEELLQGYLEGALTETESGQMLEILRAEPSRIRDVLDGLRTDGLLRAVVAECPAQASAQVDRPQSGFRTWSWRSQWLGWLRPLALAACLVLIGASTFWFLWPRVARPTLLEAAKGTSLRRTGRILTATPGLALRAGDELLTPAGGHAKIGFVGEATVLMLASETEWVLNSQAWGKRFALRGGRLEAAVAPQRWLHPLMVSTPHARVRVVGTHFTLAVTSRESRLEVDEGLVRLRDLGTGTAVKVGSGQFVVAGSGSALAPQATAGKVVREIWRNLPGDTLGDLRFDRDFPNKPTERDWPRGLESSTNWGGTVGLRLRAYLVPRAKGEYRFRITGTGQYRLSFSPDEDPSNKVTVAQFIFGRSEDAAAGGTASWQQSEAVPLEPGRRYYLEVLHTFQGDDRLVVIWQRPDGTAEPLPAEFLEPFSIPNGKEAK